MDFVKHLTVVIARFFMSAIFLASGVNKIFHWQASEAELMKVLSDWEPIVFSIEPVQMGIAAMMAWAPGFLIFATLLELLGGLLLLLGVKEKLGAFLLILFLLPTTLLFHAFWFMEGGERDLQISIFLRNVAILGGLMMFVLHGGQAGKKSEDSFSVERF
jgi:putative oxidoreductase